MKVFVVESLEDDEYGCREIVGVFASYEGAMEYIESVGGQSNVDVWFGTGTVPQFTVSEWEVS